MDELILRYSQLQENQYFDRKSARIKPKDIIKHLVAFANAEGGKLIIGIEDDGRISGFKTQRAHCIDEYKNICLIELKETPLMVRFETLDVKNENNQDDNILIISVDISANRVIKTNDGKVYLRQNDSSRELNFEQILQLQYDRGQSFFEDEVISEATLNDLNEELLDNYKEIMKVSNLSNEDVLTARNFIINGHITNAGILLFAKNPSRFLPQARLKVIKYSGVKAGVGVDINIIKEQIFDDAIPVIIKKSREFINSQLREFQYLDQDGRFKIMPEYPEFAWFEGIVNALTHRNYSIRGEYIKVLIFDDRLEIQSPGLLPNIVTIENILNQRYSRNPRIARVLSEFGWVKEMNEGVKRIYSEMEKLFLNKPHYSEPNNNVLLTLENNILNRSMRVDDKLKKEISSQKFEKLSSDERIILHYMYNTGSKMTTKIATDKLEKSGTFCRKLLKNLHKKDLLKWNGTSVNDKTQHYTLNF
ncbi:ATP-dependent DNA helicase RecG [Bisgaardia hudsonensis]|uniref:ATP-dependent DNA helicase RecG n=1 Tax=Bisgaardia hudsonensis TaxID=109472 RepID=A0A4R2MTK6_9PAST|nr:ATP-binding protein [Bisgaardia hudsonensis]QLB13775.1 ATP-dependent DNA helicase RecG [Bisgaardia hudsonensis]TCP11742.1 ATP-dependent DNA helicase RecG [Bisgaardia hudsonensis]